MEGQDWWPCGAPPVNATVSGGHLGPRHLAEAMEYQELFNKLQERLREEGQAPDPGSELRLKIVPDLSHLTAKRRAEVEDEIARLRADPEIRVSLRSRLEKTQPEIVRLMDEGE